ncbi:MAG: hypothetical protein KJ077_32810 [Anaerolineae bacterium]|nr:hypothetical protein [Anaerolineae bacterium]
MALPDTDSISANDVGNQSWADNIKDGLTQTEYAQMQNSFKADESLLYWPDLEIPNLGLRIVNEPDLSAGKWLTEYVSYAKKCSPMSPEIFHEAAGLFLLSAAVARRVTLKTTVGNLYPNLFVLLVGPPGIIHKTGAINVADNLADKADLLRLSALGTTESMSIELSFTKQYGGLDKDSDPKEYDRWYKERALAGQRSLIIREASGLFEAGRKDYLAQLRELLLQLYDCPPKLQFGLTVTRGRTTVENVYLSLLGDTTPAAMRPYFSRNAREWADGTFSRFNLLTLETRPPYHYYLNANGDDPTIPPGDLVERLSFLHYKFLKMPAVTIMPLEADKDREAIRSRLDVEPLTETSVKLGPGVVEAMRQHHKAIYDACWDAYSGQRDEKLPGVYVRLHDTAMKIAILLATIDSLDSVKPDIVITLGHCERAQFIAERWRRSLHRVNSLISKDLATSDYHDPVEKDATRIEMFINSCEGRTCSNRDLQRRFPDLAKQGRFTKVVDYLKASGRIVQTEVKRERGPTGVVFKIPE